MPSPGRVRARPDHHRARPGPGGGGDVRGDRAGAAGRGGPFDGLEIPVTENDNNLLLLDFGDARFAVVDAGFCAVATRGPEMEVFGLGGTLVVNRPGAAYGRGELPIELFRVDAAPG